MLSLPILRSLYQHALRKNSNSFIYDYAIKLMLHINEKLLQNHLYWKYDNDLLLVVSYFIAHKLYIDEYINAKHIRRLSLFKFDVKTIIEVENFICSLLQWHLIIA